MVFNISFRQPGKWNYVKFMFNGEMVSAKVIPLLNSNDPVDENKGINKGNKNITELFKKGKVILVLT